MSFNLNDRVSRTYTRASIPSDSQKMDIYDPRYPAHIWLMIFYGLLDAMWQTTSFWLIGAMSNDSNKLAIYAGFCTSRLCFHLVHMPLSVILYSFYRPFHPERWG